MKRTFMILSFFGMVMVSKAQKIDTVYFDSKWVKTDKANKHYYRIIKENTDRRTFFVKDFYSTDTTQMEGTYSSLNPDIKDGNFVWFYPDGKKKMESVFKKGKMINVVEWDENGALKKAPDLVKVTNSVTGEKGMALIERAPSYEGGMSALSEFISKNTKYPRELEKEGVRGKVVVRFTVTKDGDVIDPEVIKSVHPLLDAEAVRVVKLMKKWEPGKQDGKLIDVRFTLPFNFN
ncbi:MULTISPECIES: energy transducer TonB [unclassified Pedobacter]|uniref:energy transducer TonB n=1 Tax=unclassified Pedobacter TaxID=2628915 RepID=UPI00141F162C|nr:MULTISPECIES: energy transducer TonB [unclassified Pedobacter]NII83640.1 TonB family protein [Pedobacter sp. SG908]NMN37500.1 TonB family protein [Pedobacter sp. SG918]